MKNRRPSRAPRAASRKPAGPAQLVQIEKPVYGGSFLAREEGKAIFVPMVLPGEQARVEMIEDKSKRGYAKAEMVELVARAPERIAPRCPHFGPCGGCNYQHAPYETQLRWKQQILRETLERGGVKAADEIAVAAAQPWEYRNRIRVAFDAKGHPGYRGRRSHDIVPIRECPIAAPGLVEAALAAAEVFRERGDRRWPSELEIFSDGDCESILLDMTADAPARVPVTDTLRLLMERIPNIKGIDLMELHKGPRPSSRQWGETSLIYRGGGFGYRVDSGSFFQVNRWLIDPLIDRVVSGYRGKLAWDLFAGVGLFARQLAAHFDDVIAVEASPFAARALAANLAGSSGKALFMPVHEFLRRGASGPQPDLIVVDPPRSGLGDEIVSALGRVAALRLAYVSCDPATLARDLRGLLADGYAIDSVTLFDLFPQTFHLETVVHLRRS